MSGGFVLIAGSASTHCSRDKLNCAIQFIEAFTLEVLMRGGGIVVLAGDEEQTKDEHGTPRVFDWIALRQVEHFATTTSDSPRPYARIILSDKATESKIDRTNLVVLRNLEQRGVVQRHHIRREVFTGGEYRKVLTQKSDAMIAIGGGKGTYASAREMISLAKPVLPLDLPLGSTADDGNGAPELYREMLSDPRSFFPKTHKALRDSFSLISLSQGVSNPQIVARTAAEVLAREMEHPVANGWRPQIRRHFVKAKQIAKAIPLLAAATRLIDFLKSHIPFL